MKILKIASLPLLVALTMACKGEQKPLVEERVIEDTDPTTGIITLRDYEHSDTINIGGKLYHYTYWFEHVDSMPVVIFAHSLFAIAHNGTHELLFLLITQCLLLLGRDNRSVRLAGFRGNPVFFRLVCWSWFCRYQTGLLRLLTCCFLFLLF